MAQTWSPEDEEGFGIRGADEEALTEEQQKALDDLRVQTARDNQEYLHDHPEVKAMLSLLIRETLQQERDVRSVAGQLFRSEKQVVAAVRRMLAMEPRTTYGKKRRSDDDDLAGREVTFSDISVRRGRQRDKELPSKPPDKPRLKRRDTPAPWIEHQLLKLTETAGEMASQDGGVRPNLSWLQRELEELADKVNEGSSRGAGRQSPWVHTGKSCAKMRDAIAGDDLGVREEEVIPLARRDTPAPWSVMEHDTSPEKREREKYVLGLLEKILEEPVAGAEDSDIFGRLERILEEAD